MQRFPRQAKVGRHVPSAEGRCRAACHQWYRYEYDSRLILLVLVSYRFDTSTAKRSRMNIWTVVVALHVRVFSIWRKV
eukprot:scaffold46099_cov15-Prasinocladus_malaysianus.AAC.1